MITTYIQLGSNLGDRQQQLQMAVQAFEEKAGKVELLSSIYETAPWGVSNQEPFLNQVFSAQTNLEPTALLEVLLGIENEMGRQRSPELHWGPRTIDLDILFYGDQIVEDNSLQIPHPQLANRRFVLTPLNDIAPQLTHPVLKKTVEQLLAECPDLLPVNTFACGTV